MQILIILSLALTSAFSQYLSLDMLGPNIVVNGDFQLYSISPDFQRGYSSMGAWHCSNVCVVTNLKAFDQKFNVTFFEELQSLGQFVNMNSIYGVNQMSQDLLFQQGYYFFTFLFVPAISQPAYKQLIVSLGGSTIGIIYFQQDMPINILQYIASFRVSVAGVHTLKFKMIGYNDWFGFMLKNVKMRRFHIDQLMSGSINSTFQNSAINTLNTLPGIRILANSVVNFFTNFDRLEFYSFHNTNYSYYSSMLINSIVEFQNQKGSFVLNYLNNQSYVNFTQINNQILNFDFKINYTDRKILQKNSNGNGFIANNFMYFLYQLPVIIILQILFWIIFRLTFKFYISVAFRKYCFMGTILFLFFQGNVQNFSYYFFFELTTFFNINIYHKCINYFIILFGFLTLFYSFASILWFKFVYGKKLKYFCEYSKKNIIGCIFNEMFQKSIFPLLFGSVHLILYKRPNYQLLMLTLIEIAMLSLRINFLVKGCIFIQFRAWICNISSLLRLGFILSFYVYSNLPDFQIPINDMSKVLVGAYLVNWALQTFLELVYYTYISVKIIKERCKSQKDQNPDQDIESIKSGNALIENHFQDRSNSAPHVKRQKFAMRKPFVKLTRYRVYVKK